MEGKGERRGGGNAERGMEGKRTEEEKGGWKDEWKAGARKKKTKQSGQIRFGMEGSELGDYSN